MIIQPHFHVGLAVPVLEQAMADLARTGVRWRDVMAYPLCVLHESGTSQLDLRAVYSCGEAPAIELFEGHDGTPLSAPAAGSQFHHVGFWTDDLAGDVAQLASGGWPLAATVADDTGQPSRFALHRTPFGFYLELVDAHWAGRLLGDLLPPNLQRS